MVLEIFLGYIVGNLWNNFSFFCGILDFKHLYDLQRWRLLTNVRKKVAFLSSFFDAVELEYRYVLLLSDKYLTTKHRSFVSAVHEHFGNIVLARDWVHVYL